jgi:hypothetical protein
MGENAVFMRFHTHSTCLTWYVILVCTLRRPILQLTANSSNTEAGVIRIDLRAKRKFFMEVMRDFIAYLIFIWHSLINSM